MCWSSREAVPGAPGGYVMVRKAVAARPPAACGEEKKEGKDQEEGRVLANVPAGFRGERVTLDVVDLRNEKVGSLEVSDEVFGGRVNTDVIWEAVVHQLASERAAPTATKTRGQGPRHRKEALAPERHRPRAGSAPSRNPLWRTGGIVFGPQPRSYAYPRLPKKVIRGGVARGADPEVQGRRGACLVDQLAVEEPRTRHAADLLNRSRCEGQRRLLVDVNPDTKALSRAVRNITGSTVVVQPVVSVPTGRGRCRPDRHDTCRGRATGAGAGIMKATEVIRRPLITEKTTIQREDGR